MKKKGILLFLTLTILTATTLTLKLLTRENQGSLNEALPTPFYIESMFPYPGSTLSVTDYQEPANAPFVALDKSSICLELWGKELLEPGDNLTTEEILSRFKLVVDGHEHLEPSSTYNAASEKQEGEFDLVTNKVLFYIPAGFPAILCYRVSLEPGKHRIKLTYLTTSQKSLDYSWTFYLTES